MPEEPILDPQDLRNDQCFFHQNAECTLCPYYRYTFTVGQDHFEGGFWFGQSFRCATPDGQEGVWIEPEQYQHFLSMEL